MQTIHKVGLILTGSCVLLICVGIGIGIAHSGKSDLNDTIIEYEAYDEDYVDYVKEGRVIDVIPREEGTREMDSLTIHSL